MTLFFTKVVHTTRDVDVVTFRPGDPVPDWWAKGRDINPDVVEDRDETVKQDDTPAPSDDATVDDLDKMTAAQLKEVAKGLGLPGKGNKDTLRAAIRAARDEGDESPEDSERATLEAAATAKGLEFTAETTDSELEALIEGA